MSRREALTAFTGLRGVAAVWVVVFHLRPWLALPAGIDRLAGAGHAAVDVFFTLSGFVLAYQHGSIALTPRAWLEFAWRRLARIAPLHLAITLGLAAVVTARGWWDQAAYAPSHLLAHLTLSQGWTLDAATAWNEPAWSVSAEWHAYLAFPLLALAARRVRGPRVAAGAALVLALVPHVWFDLDAIAGGVMFVRLGCGFSAGLLLARARELGFVAARGTAELAGLGVVLAAVAGAPALIPALGVLVVLALATRGGPLARALGRPLVAALGERSYALYLVHGAALLALWKLAPLGASALRHGAGIAAYAALVVGGTWVAHAGIEVPARRRLLELGARRATGGFPCPPQRIHPG